MNKFIQMLGDFEHYQISAFFSFSFLIYLIHHHFVFLSLFLDINIYYLLLLFAKTSVVKSSCNLQAKTESFPSEEADTVVVVFTQLIFRLLWHQPPRGGTIVKD